MSNLYDEQFKRRVAMHMMNCDPTSAEIISSLCRYVEHPELRHAGSSKAVADTGREAFEKWARQQEGGTAERLLFKRDDGEYDIFVVRAAYDAWQAATAVERASNAEIAELIGVAAEDVYETETEAPELEAARTTAREIAAAIRGKAGQ